MVVRSLPVVVVLFASLWVSASLGSCLNKNHVCNTPENKNDGYCDEECSYAGCNFDGHDCCPTLGAPCLNDADCSCSFEDKRAIAGPEPEPEPEPEYYYYKDSKPRKVHSQKCRGGFCCDGVNSFHMAEGKWCAACAEGTGACAECDDNSYLKEVFNSIKCIARQQLGKCASDVECWSRRNVKGETEFPPRHCVAMSGKNKNCCGVGCLSCSGAAPNVCIGPCREGYTKRSDGSGRCDESVGNCKGCPVHYIGDGNCDQRCNNAECQFDGGDCGTALPTSPVTASPATASPTSPAKEFKLISSGKTCASTLGCKQITSVAECNQAMREETEDTRLGRHSKTLRPKGCWVYGKSVYFNTNSRARGKCTSGSKCLCSCEKVPTSAPSSPAPTEPSSPAPTEPRVHRIIASGSRCDATSGCKQITSVAECNQAMREETEDTMLGRQSKTLRPKGCWVYGKSVYFNTNSRARGKCTAKHKCLCSCEKVPTSAPSSPAPTEPSSPAPTEPRVHRIIASGSRCDATSGCKQITSVAECNQAMREETKDTRLGRHSKTLRPKGCWVYGKSVYFNKHSRARGKCSAKYKCLCSCEKVTTEAPTGNPLTDEPATSPPTAGCGWIDNGSKFGNMAVVPSNAMIKCSAGRKVTKIKRTPCFEECNKDTKCRGVHFTPQKSGGVCSLRYCGGDSLKAKPRSLKLMQVYICPNA